jgi:hypothetical protein
VCPRLGSPLYPNLASQRRVRVYYSDGAGTINPLFYGVLRPFKPGRMRAPVARLSLQSFLDLLATEAKIVLPHFSAGAAIYDYTDAGTKAASVLTQVLQTVGEADLPEAAWNIQESGDYHNLEQDWGGTETTFGAAMADLAQQGDFLWCMQPLYRTTDDGTNFLLCVQPLTYKATQPADLAWDLGAQDIQEHNIEWTDLVKP